MPVGWFVAYDWETISAQRNSEESYYRLLGEMLHRRASSVDLQRIRQFLGSVRLGADVWLSLGEGLYCTTRGSSVGYRMWSAWSRSVQLADFDESHQLEAWRRFQIGSSDALEVSSDADDTSLRDPTLDDDLTARTRETDRARPTAQDPSAIALIPGGGHTIRLFDEVFEGVDEFGLLSLLQSGVFFQLDVLFGVRWISVAEHPGFTSLVARLRDEAMAQLATTERAHAEVTQPGTG